MFKPQRLEPKAGQESAWDYPRPPRLEKVGEQLRVVFNRRTIADTRAGYRVLETSHPPVYYLPSRDAAMEFLELESGHSWCEFKGQASYWSLNVNERRSVKAAWSYPRHRMAFMKLPGIWRFTLHASMNAGSTMNACSRKSAISMEAGLLPESLAPSRAPPVQVGGRPPES